MPNGLIKVKGKHDYFVNDFFNAVIEDAKLKFGWPKKKIVFVTVNHIVPTLPYFLSALSQLGEIRRIIPKASHVDPETRDRVKKRVKQQPEVYAEDVNKDKLRDPIFIKIFLKELKLQPEERCIILDIGGYFADALALLSSDEYRPQFLGIIEDTENGEQRYRRVLKENSLPVIPFARDPYKKDEDDKVGLAIVQAADTILRKGANTLIEAMTEILVLGFGKIGNAIATSLKNKGKNVRVYDKNPERVREAAASGFDVIESDDEASRDRYLGQADIIFCATGNQALEGKDFNKLSHNVFISCCTSAREELALDFLEKMAVEERVASNSKKISVFIFEDGRCINLLRRGNATNFGWNAVSGPAVYEVQAAILAGVVRLANFKSDAFTAQMTPRGGVIYQMKREDLEFISKNWVSCFASTGSLQNQRFKIRSWGVVNSANLSSLVKRNELQVICDRLNKAEWDTPDTLLIHGPSGAGKTSIATQIFYQFPHVVRIWFNAGSIEQLNMELFRLAQQMGIVFDASDTERMIHRVKDYFEKHPEWLIVFDNVQDGRIIKYLPQHGGKILLITTREIKDFSNIKFTGTYKISEMSDNEARALVGDSFSTDQFYTMKTPLALELVRSYNKNPQASDLSSNGEIGYEKRLKHVVKLLVSLMQASNAEAYELLAILAYFLPTGIPKDLLKINVSAGLKENIKILEENRLVKETSGYIYMHILIQEAMRELLLGNGSAQQIVTRILKGLGAMLDQYNYQQRLIDEQDKLLQYMPHIVRTLSFALDLGLYESVLKFLVRYEDIFKFTSYVNEFVSIALKTIEHLSREDVDIVMLKLIIAMMYAYQGKYREMGELLESLENIITNYQDDDLESLKLQCIAYYTLSGLYRRGDKKSEEKADRYMKLCDAAFALLESKAEKNDEFFRIKGIVFYNRTLLVIEKNNPTIEELLSAYDSIKEANRIFRHRHKRFWLRSASRKAKLELDLYQRDKASQLTVEKTINKLRKHEDTFNKICDTRSRLIFCEVLATAYEMANNLGAAMDYNRKTLEFAKILQFDDAKARCLKRGISIAEKTQQSSDKPQAYNTFGASISQTLLHSPTSSMPSPSSANTFDSIARSTTYTPS